MCRNANSRCWLWKPLEWRGHHWQDVPQASVLIGSNAAADSDGRAPPPPLRGLYNIEKP
jgi:hypothetical protein